MRFSGHSLFDRPSGGRNLFILRFYRHSLFGRPSGGHVFFVLRVYGNCIFGRPFGGHTFYVLRIYWPFLVIFTAGHSVGPLSVLTERGERATKGLQSRPLESGFLYGGLEGRRAYSVRVRPGAIYAI